MPFSDLEIHAAFKKLSMSDLCAYIFLYSFDYVACNLSYTTDSAFILLKRINGHSILVGVMLGKKLCVNFRVKSYTPYKLGWREY